MFFEQDKPLLFSDLGATIDSCDLCPRLCSRRKVFSRHNGNIDSKVLFIAEAPGRLGADCTGIPLYGDKTGDNFEQLLGNIGWSRENIFITNSVLCNPQDEEGNNSTPTKEEVLNCSYFLEMTIELINPEVIVTLGVKALEALSIIEKHDYILKKHVGQAQNWCGRTLFPLYHMGPRATIHRPLIKQRSDFIALSNLVDPIKGIKKKTQKKVSVDTDISNSILLQVALEFIRKARELSFYKLTKLLYLLDYYSLKERGHSITGSIYLRLQEGPWIPTLKDALQTEEGEAFQTLFRGRKPFLTYLASSQSKSSLDSDTLEYVDGIFEKYKTATDAQIKIIAYHTPPMRYIMQQEDKGRKMAKCPVLYKDTTIIDEEAKQKQQV